MSCEFVVLYSAKCPRATTQLQILQKMVTDYPSQITFRTYDIDNPTEKNAARSERLDAYRVHHKICKKSPTTSLYRGGMWIQAWCGEQTADALLGGCSGTMASTPIHAAPARLTTAAASEVSTLNIAVDVRTYQPGNE